MRKIIVSVLMLGALTIPATAKVKSKKTSSHIPYHQNPVIDHSYDRAYSAKWANQAQSPAPDADFRIGNVNYANSALRGKTYFYSLDNFTLYGAYPVSMNAPYEGKDAPSYDGVAKNKYRNMRANNESEPLPPNNGE